MNKGREAGIRRVLVVEDSEAKWGAVQRVLAQLSISAMEVTRAATLVDAEAQITREAWDLIILDVSMDITANQTGTRRGGHDALGGLRVANKMFLLGYEAPTIIVTAFDAFPSGEVRRGEAEILGLEDVTERARALLGVAFLGCVRYGDAGWDDQLTLITRKVLCA